MLNLLFSSRETDYEPIYNQADREPYPGTKIPGYPSCCTLNRLAICCCGTGTVLATAGAAAITLIARSDLPSSVKIGVFVAGGVVLMASMYCWKSAVGVKIADRHFETMHKMDPDFMKNFAKMQADMGGLMSSVNRDTSPV